MNPHIIEAFPHKPEADTFDFQKSIGTIKQAIFSHRLIIALTTFFTLAVIVAYMMIWPAVYQAEVILIADSPDDMQRIEFYNHWNVFRKNHLPDEIEMMTSGKVLGKVVDELNLTFNDVYHTFTGHLGYLWVESWIGKKYRAVKAWIFSKPPSPYTPTPEEIERARTIDSFKKGVGLRPVPETNVGALIVRGPSPAVADIANKLIDTYMRARQERLLEEANIAYEALHNEVKKAGDELNQLEIKMEQYYRDNGMLLAFEKDKIQVSNALGLETTIKESEASLSSLQETLKNINRQLETVKKEEVTGHVLAKNSIKQQLRSQVVQLQVGLEQAKLRYRDDSPEVLDIESQIKSLTDMWEKENALEKESATTIMSDTYRNLLSRKSSIETEIEGLKASLKVRQQTEVDLTNKINSIPEKMKLSRGFEREHQILEKKYVALSDKMMIAAISRATINSAPSSIRILDYAKYPEKPYAPNKKLLLLGGLIFGLIFGIMLALLVDFIYGRVNRYRLSLAQSHYDVYAIVSRDQKFLGNLYGIEFKTNKTHEV